MEENVLECMKFLKCLRERGKSYGEFRISIHLLQEEASARGLDKIIVNKILEILRFTDLGSNNIVTLIKCTIPKDKIDDNEIEKLIVWFLSIPAAVTTLSTVLEWIIGCWEYQLINRSSVYVFYDPLFFTLMKEERLQSRLAQLIYLMTKPEDVTRRQVLRLLKLSQLSRKPPKHIIALLSLFKSYKPEFVPEKIPAINIQSAWRPISEALRKGFEQTRNRILSKEVQNTNEFSNNWNIFHVSNNKKNQEPLVPSVGYFNIGSSIFDNKTEKSIFDVSNILQLGQYQSCIKLPCNATSLLATGIGYHLLTYTNIEYQLRFMYNLYNTFWKSFIFENGRYSEDEMNRILDMTMEFCRYMQHGIPIVNYFINDYLSRGMDDHHIKLLSLMQWSSISIPQLQDYVLKHVKLMFYGSSINIKIKIIRTLRMLLLNLSVMSDDAFRDKSFPFLGQCFTGKLTEYAQVIENFSRELIGSSLNAHNYDTIILSEALSFYEQIDVLEICKKTSFVTLAPTGVIHGCFISSSSAVLSRVCALLMQCRKYFKDRNEQSFDNNKKWLIMYAEDLVSMLWYDNCFSNRHAKNRYFLRNLPEIIMKSNPTCDIDRLLNINQHFAVLPYLYSIYASGLHIKTKRDAINVAARYYPHINNFILAFLNSIPEK